MADAAPQFEGVEAARAAGYSDAQIADHIASLAGVDISAARKAGYDDAAIVDYLAPPRPVETPRPVAPPSGMLRGMGKAAGQTAIESGAKLETGVGAVTKMVGQAEPHQSSLDVGLMQRLDQGEDLRTLMKAAPNDLARLALREYQVATPEKRAEIRQSAMNEAATPPGAVERAGSNIMAGGEKLATTAQTTFPLTPEEESRSSVKVAKMVAGLAPYLVAGAAGGLPAVIGYGGVEAFGTTYEEAKKAGASDADATGAALISGTVQGGMMAVPLGHAMKVMEKVPQAFKGEFIKTLGEMVGSGATLTAFSQVSQLADNVIAKNTYEPNRPLTQGLGENIPETMAAGMVLPVVGATVRGAVRKIAPDPAKIMDAPTVDDAIATAKASIGTPVDVEPHLAQAREFGGATDQDQAALLKLFGGLNTGTVEQAPDGGYHFRTGEETVPLRLWNERVPHETEGEQPKTISPQLAAAQRDHYEKMGVKVVYFENDPGIPFDGAVDPRQPNTIFLSNDPERNATQVAAHEVTHVLEGTKLPDGTNLGDLLHQQVTEGITNAGWRHAVDMFGQTAPDRAAFPTGPEGDAAHADAVVSHLVRELGADIGGEAPKFQTFIPRVVDAVQARYGLDAAKDVLGKLVAGIRQAMQTLRSFFFRPEEHAEFGQPDTVSQHWVTNLGEIHDTLARMYAERFGTQAEKENSALAAMRDKAQRDRMVKAPEGPAVIPAAPAAAPSAAYAEAAQKAATYRRWIGELEQQGASEADIGRVRRAFFDERRRMAAARQGEPTAAEARGERKALPAPALVTPPPRRAVTPENVFQPETYGAPPGSAAVSSDNVRQRATTPVEPVPPERKQSTGVVSPSAEPATISTRVGLAFQTQLAKEQAAVKAMKERRKEPEAPKPEASPAASEAGEKINIPEPKPEPVRTGPRPNGAQPEAKPESKPEAPAAKQGPPEHQFAEAFADMLERGTGSSGGVTGRLKIPSGDVQRLADRVFGGTLGEGAYSRDRLYDAMELGVNRYIQRHPERFNPAVDATKAKEVAAEIARIKDSLPTQTVRAGEKDTHQQFSTPPDYAYAANWVANLRPTDHVLEPSAGVGGLIVHAMNADVRETTVNELSDKRRGMIEALNPTRTTGEDAAQLHNILPGDVRPTVVVMNPPFSRSAERMGSKMVLDEGAKHIEQALARLEPGGRLVAIVGDGMKPEGTITPGSSMRQGSGKAFADWWKKIGAEYDVRANIGVDRDIYSKYGTAFPTRLLVIDKNEPSGRQLVTGQARDASDLIDKLQEVRNDRGTVEHVAGEPGRKEVAPVAGPERELPRPTRVVGTGEGTGGSTGADGAEPAGGPQRGTAGGDAVRNGAGSSEPVHPVEPGHSGRGAGEPPRRLAEPSEEPAGGGKSGGGDGVRPDGSGERDDPGVTPAPESVLATENATAAPGDQALTEAVYEPYKPQRVQIVGAKAHPGALVQSAAMASVLPPKTEYKPRIPASIVKDGLLSDAQLEAVTYAGHAHSDVMPDGKRRGYFIGDGTGVGKGREIAGIFLDNKQQGRTKGLWISESRALINDAKRDWNGLGQPATDIIEHGKTKAGDAIKGSKGILFTTYNTLKGGEQTKVEGEKVKGKTRVDQIVDWVGKDFDGVIAFDEAHNMGNSSDEKVAGGRGTKKAAQKALAGIELQNKLPNARVVYVSATGATDVRNLGYLDRLGLWGEGTSFPKRETFVGQMTSGGMAAMEVVARDMKALGQYISRNLSYEGVDYDRVEHTLSPDQRATYDKLAEGWQVALRNINEALEITGGTKDGKSTGTAKSTVLSAFWSAQQRFFNQVITSMQMPSVIKGVEADIKAKRQAVLQLVNTMEAAQDRAIEKKRAEGGGELEDLDMTPRDQLMQMVEKSFPVAQMEEYVDESGNVRSQPVKDKAGNPVLNKQAVAMRERLLDELGSLRVPDGPLEMLLNHFGTDKVAEVTGRGQRVVLKPDETGQMKTQLEKRGSGANVAESNLFQEGKKPILVFSAAGGTGRSYHAAIGSGSENARRSHYLVQGGWQADKAVQGFGRTHRTNQASAPIFHLVTTDLQGQKRFISSIARRLGQLGALTKGERRTGDQGMFGLRDNLESAEAKSGLKQFFDDVARGEVEGVGMKDLEEGMGLKLFNEQGQPQYPKMEQFLNRLLSLKFDHQNRVFNAFSERLDQSIDRASAAGTLDTGVEVYKADKLNKVNEQTVYTDPRSGAETKHVHLNAQNRNYPKSFDATLAGRNKTNGKVPEGWVQNERSGNVFAVTSAGSRTDAKGTVYDQKRLTSPVDYQFVDAHKIGESIYGETNWRKLTEAEARPLWEKQVAATPEFRNSDLHIITGAVLPIWDRLGGSPKIFRLQTDAGERMLGRVIPSSTVDATLKKLGAESMKVTAPPAEIAQRILGGEKAKLANDWTIKSSRVAGENRLELIGPDFQHRAELERAGVFSERIQSTTRWFIPTEPGAAAKAIERITKSRPVTSLSDGAEQTRFSPKPSRDDKAFNVYGDLRAAGESAGSRMQDDLLRKYDLSPADFSRFLERVNRLSLSESARFYDAIDQRNKRSEVFAPEAAAEPRKRGGPITDVEFSPKPKEPFYSALTRGVEGMRMEKAAPGQWEATLRNMPGIKSEERAWVGLDDWLRQQTKSVTKADVLDFLRANEVQVREVEKGGVASDRLRELDAIPPGFRTPEQVREMNELRAGGANPDNLPRSRETKYAGYTLPGGKNYRELLLTLPGRSRPPTFEEWYDKTHIAPLSKYRNDSAMMDIFRRKYEAEMQAMPREGNFRSGHFDEPNILAHIRFDDRTGPNGEKVLHVAEVQSDWHQKGRKEGYSAPRLKATDLKPDGVEPGTEGAKQPKYWFRLPDGRKTINGNDRIAGWGRTTEEARANALALENTAPEGIPDAPFKTTWPELAMKRMIRYAAEHGYDRISWDTGTTNADRYDLSKHVSSIRYHDDGKLIVRDHNSQEVLRRSDVTAADLPDLIGKEAADKLMGQEPGEDGIRALDGLDLKMGGEGMKAFYDKQLPIVANKIGKKFGAKVEDAMINKAPADPMEQQPFGDVQGGIAVHSLAITPAMRESVMQGQPLFSPKLTGDTGRKYTPEERQAFANVGRTVSTPTLHDKINNARDDIGRKLVRETLDAYIGLKANDPQGYMAARLANSVAGAQEVFRLHGTLKFNGATYDYKDLNGGVRGLVKALGGEAHDFMWWVAAHRAERLKDEDRENLFSQNDIDALKQLNRGQLPADYTLSNGKTTRNREAAYTDALGRLDVLNKNALDLGVESGLLKRGDVDALWSNPFYVPFYREAEASGSHAFAARVSSGFVKQNAFKALKGGSEKLNHDLWENAFGNWDHMIDAALRNRAGAQILDTATRLGAAEKVSTQDYNYRMSKAEKAETAWAMVGGEKQQYRVSDPMVFKAVSALEAASTPGPIMSVARWFSRALRYGVTANPLFAVRNLIRDTENTIAVSQISTNPLKNLADGFAQIDVGDRLNNLARAMAGKETETAGLKPEAVSAMAGGALMRLGTASDAGIAKTTLLDSPGKLRAFGRYIGEVAGAYKEALASGEDINRLALYHQMREEGAPHDLAAFSARDLQDFTLRGAAPFVRTITDITPFLGARLQGLYKLGRAASDADKNVAVAVGGKVARNLVIRTAAVMGAMTLAGLALDAIYHDDEDYKKRTEYDRQTYYWFKIGDAQFRVPKGFELAALSSLATDGIEAFFDKEMTGRRLVNNFWTALSTNLQVQAPAAIQPVIDLATNTRGTGGPIETAGMERLEPQERYTADTTLVARGLSTAINAGLRVAAPRVDGPSPVQIDYLANAYGGWLASATLGMADTAMRSASNEPVRPSGDFWAQATQGLVRTEAAPQSRYVDMLYEQGKQIEEAHATFLNLLKRGRGEEARAFFQDHKEDMVKYPALEGVKHLESKINQQIRVITDSATMSADQKHTQIMRLQAMKNKAAESVFRAMQ